MYTHTSDPDTADNPDFPTHYKGVPAVAQDIRDDIYNQCPKDNQTCDTNLNQEMNGYEIVDDINTLLFSTPPTSEGTIVDVYVACREGSCKCTHFIGGKRAQLLPCRFASYLWKGAGIHLDEDWELFCGIVDGFDVVDSEATTVQIIAQSWKGKQKL